MAEVEVRIAEAEAALAEALDKSTRSLLERDGAILRLIYTFEAVWKASQQPCRPAEALACGVAAAGGGGKLRHHQLKAGG